MRRVKKLFNAWLNDRQQLRELLIKLEYLTDYTLLDRSQTAEWYRRNGL